MPRVVIYPPHYPTRPVTVFVCDSAVVNGNFLTLTGAREELGDPSDVLEGIIIPAHMMVRADIQ